MLDFIVLIVILWVLNLSSNKNKKKKHAANESVQRSASVQAEKTRRNQREKETHRPKNAEAESVPEMSRASKHLISQIEMELAAQKAHERTMMPKKAAEKRSIELPKEDSTSVDGPILGGETAENRRKQALAQDMLRGVVMAEILTRPSERAAIQKMRRSR